MTFLYYFYAALMTLGLLLAIFNIDKPCTPTTPALAVATIIVQAPMVYLLIRAALAGV